MNPVSRRPNLSANPETEPPLLMFWYLYSGPPLRTGIVHRLQRHSLLLYYTCSRKPAECESAGIILNLVDKAATSLPCDTCTCRATPKQSGAQWGVLHCCLSHYPAHGWPRSPCGILLVYIWPTKLKVMGLNPAM